MASLEGFDGTLQRVGPYRIERTLGHGGMGTVYLAVREGDFEQQVALKVLRGPADRELLVRFTNERQILANLQHPGIAGLLDGGTDAFGRPYLVMEYVDGERIDVHCATHRLPVAARLALVQQVCDAVQRAHQNLVVHRDIKPSNILITRDGTPRLLDFGIAKLLGDDHRIEPLATQPGHAPMTPAFASPEQVRGESITTTCDVYGLGVLLYCLLAGRPPFRLDGLGYDEIVALVCERDPLPPSQAARRSDHGFADTRETMPTQATEADAAADADEIASTPTRTLPGIEHHAWARVIEGDLDAIVMKAIRKEPEHRYGSAAALAEDLERYLDGRPVTARHGTWRYVTGKYVRRHRVALVAVSLILIFAVMATLQWRTAVHQRAQAEHALHRAEREATRAERVTAFLEGLFRVADPDERRGQNMSVAELLARGRDQLDEELEAEPEIRAELYGTLGSVHRNLGDFESAVALKTDALRVRREASNDDRPALAKDINNLASVLYARGDYVGAEEQLRQALAMRERLGQSGTERVTTMFNLASTLARRGVLDEAEVLHRRCLAIYRDAHGAQSEEVASSLYSLATIATHRGRDDETETLLRQAIAIRESQLGPDHTRVARLYNSLGRALHRLGRLEEAEDALGRARAARRERLGPDHASVAQTEKNLAAVVLDRGRVDEAEALIVHALDTLRQSLPDADFAILDAERVRGDVLIARQRYDEAEALLRHSLEGLSRVRGATAPPTRAARQSLAGLYRTTGRDDEAEALLALPRDHD